MDLISHCYHLDESIIIFGASGVIFHLFYFSMKIKIANSIALFGTPRLPMSHKKDVRRILVKINS